MVRNRQSQDLYRGLRREMIRETEEFLEEGLRDPRRAVRIPSVPVGIGRFSQQFASAFWTNALGIPETINDRFRRVICQLFRR